MSTEAAPQQETNGWRRFWNRGGVWRALLLVAAYWLIFQGLTLLVAQFTSGLVSDEGPFADAATVFWGTAFAILLGGALLMVFAFTLGWVRDLFGRQPISGSWWMWIAPIAILAFNILRYASADYSVFGAEVVLMMLFTGLIVGFTEELLTRGLLVTLMRKRGYGEWMVMFVSSLGFAALHIGYLWTAGLAVGLFELVYTFLFGVLMYLTLRVTGNLIWPMLLHASTDPSIFLNTGAIGEVAQAGTPGPLDQIAGLANPVVIVVGLVLMIFVRGRVTPKEQAAA